MAVTTKTASENGAKPRRLARRPPAGRVRGFGLVVLMAIASTMMFALPIFLILVVASVPPLVAYFIDRDSEKYAAVAVGTLSLSGALPYILDLWLNTFTIREAVLILADPYTWLVIYGAAAAGWLMYFMLPIAAHIYLKMSSDHRIAILQKECEALVKEWGSAIGDSAEKS